MINIFFGKLGLEDKKDEVLSLINELNRTYSASKFVLSKSNELILQVPYVSLIQDFNGEVVIDLLRELLIILVKKEYVKFHDILGDGMMMDFEDNYQRP